MSLILLTHVASVKSKVIYFKIMTFNRKGAIYKDKARYRDALSAGKYLPLFQRIVVPARLGSSSPA